MAPRTRQQHELEEEQRRAEDTAAAGSGGGVPQDEEEGPELDPELEAPGGGRMEEDAPPRPTATGSAHQHAPAYYPQRVERSHEEEHFNQATRSELFRSIPRFPGDDSMDAHLFATLVFSKVKELVRIFPSVPKDRLYYMFASTCLEKDVALWWHAEKEKLPTWDAFFDAFLKKYGDPNIKLKAGEALHSIKQGNLSIEDYVTAFRKVYDRAVMVRFVVSQDTADFLFRNGLTSYWKGRLQTLLEGNSSGKPIWPDGAYALERSARAAPQEEWVTKILSRGNQSHHNQPQQAYVGRNAYPNKGTRNFNSNNNNNKKSSDNYHFNKNKGNSSVSTNSVKHAGGIGSEGRRATQGASAAAESAVGVGNRPDITCYGCGQVGHFKSQCPNNKK